MTSPLEGPRPGEFATATVELAVEGERFEARMTVPAGVCAPSRLLPALRPLSEALVGVAVERARADGRTVSCAKGCGACCRQLVPISPTEAREIARLVEELPEPRKSRVRERFVAAKERLTGSGLLPLLADPESFADTAVQQLGLDYFQLGIACPFLEDESCSIYPDRPISCREYLVSSPPEHCAHPSTRTIRTIEPTSKVWIALARLEEDPARRFIPWVPLSLAPEWAAAHVEEPAQCTGPELLRLVLEKLSQKKRKAPPP
jgi:Fe-S-cluster containining protein